MQVNQAKIVSFQQLIRDKQYAEEFHESISPNNHDIQYEEGTHKDPASLILEPVTRVEKVAWLYWYALEKKFTCPH